MAKNFATKVFFGLNRSDLSNQTLTTLKSLLKAAKAAFKRDSAKRVIVQVVGYVQPTKKNPFPGSLSTARAQNVANWLKSNGIVGKYVVTGAGNARRNVAASRAAEISINWG